MALVDIIGPLPGRTNWSKDANFYRSAYWNFNASISTLWEGNRWFVDWQSIKGTLTADISAGTALIGTPVWNATGTNSPVPVTPGETFSAMIAISTDLSSVSMQIQLLYYTSAGVLIGSPSNGPQVPIVPDGTFTQVIFRNDIVPATAAFVRVMLLTVNALATGNVLWFGGSDFARGVEYDTFISGSFRTIDPSYSWSGAILDSTSIRAADVPQGLAGVGGQVLVDCRVWASDVKGQLYDELSDYVLGGEISNDIDRDIKGTLKLNVTDTTKFPAFTWVRVFMYVTREVEGTTTAYSLGLFRLEQPDAEWFEGSGSVSGLDPTVMLYQATTSNTYNIAAGTTYVAAVKTILDSLGFTGRYSMPDDTRAVPTGGLSFPSGTKFSAIVNKCFDAIGCFTVYALPDGTLASQPYLDRIRTEPTHIFVLGQNAELIGSVREECNDDNIYNHVVATKTSNSQAITTATAENAEPSHPFSTVSLGALAGVSKVYRSKPITVNDAADLATLTARAKEELERSSMMRYATVMLMPHPEHVPHEVVELVFDGTDAEHLSGRWYVDASSMGLSGAEAVMTMKMRRVESYGQ